MFDLSGGPLPLGVLHRLSQGGQPVRLDPAARTRMEDSRRVVEQIVQGLDAVYGVNTGFGKLADARVPNDRFA